MKPFRILLSLTVVSLALAIPPVQHSGINRTRSEMLLRAERWPVKVGADADATGVALAAPLPTSVGALRAAPRPVPNQEYRGAFEQSIHSKRLDVVEKTYFAVDCLLIGAKWENSPRSGDSDYHIVIADPQTNETMIAEIPDPRYVPSNSPFAALVTQVRRQFEQTAGHLSSSFRRFPHPIHATVYGLGFWDFGHGQIGVAPNAVEIHPVLRIDSGQGS